MRSNSRKGEPLSKRSTSLVTILLMLTVIIVSVPYLSTPKVNAALVVALSPVVAQPGQVVYVSATGATVVVGTGCQITANYPGLIASSSASVVSSGTVAGSFTVASSAAEQVGGYIISLSCPSAATPTDSGSKPFDVAPKVTVSPSIGVGGQTVSITGVGFETDMTTCTITSTPGGLILTGTMVCNVTGTGTVSGSFTVDPVAADAVYTVNVVPDAGPSSTTAQFRKVSSATIAVSPSHVPPGYGTLTGSGVPSPVSVAITGGGFSTTASSRSCTISSSGGPTVFASSPAMTCTISSSGTVAGSFAVANGATPAAYSITVKDSSFPTTASVSFTVDPVPSITLTPTSGPSGTTVIITGSGFAGGQTFDTGACTISSTPSSIITVSSCFVDSTGAIAAGSSFVVASSATIQGYTILVTAIHGDFGSAPFVVGGGGLTITLNPSTGQPGQAVLVTATGATVPVSTACTITGSITGLVTVPAATVSSPGVVTGSFTVGTVPGSVSGSYTITLTCTAGSTTNSGTASFTVIPAVTLAPTSGAAGVLVTVSGNGFRADITSCTITGTPVTLATCSVPTSGTVSGTFTVSNPAADGVYTITVSGNTGSSGTAQFQKISTPTILISPTSASPGYGTATGAPSPVAVTVTGGAFAAGSGSRSCTLSSTGAGTLFASSPAITCTISSSGSVTGSFAVVAGATPGPYTIKVTDSTSPTSATTPFTVNPMPDITLSATTGFAGTAIKITSGVNKFQLTLDAGPCTITSNPTGLITSPTCFIDSTGTITAPATGFVVGATATGSYTVIVTGLHGDFGQAVFTVIQTTLVITPTAGSPPLGSLLGTTVTVTGTGFAPQDTSCTITQAPFIPPATPNILSSVSCTITNGKLSASFVVASGATFATYTLTVQGSQAFDTNTVSFDVLPRILLNPDHGPVGTGPVSVTGTGFTGGSGPAVCNTFTSSPNVFALSPVKQCTLNNDGTVVGSFYVDAAAPQGGSTINVIGVATDSASAIFVVAARLLTVTPSSGFPAYSGVLGTFVSVNGTGFDPTDTTCTLSSSPAGLTLTGATCTITNGNVVGTFQVGSGSTAGVYNIKATGAPVGDIGIGIFTVGVVTASTTTVTSSTLTFTTTSITTSSSTTQVSTSFSTTTLQTTGVKTESYTSFTRTTTSALTTITTTYTTTFVSTVYLLTTTVLTTLSTVITHTLGQIIGVHESIGDGFGVLALLLVLGPMIIRRRWKS